MKEMELGAIDPELAEEIASISEDGYDMDPDLWDWLFFELHPARERYVRQRLPRDFEREAEPDLPGYHTLVMRLGSNCYSRIAIINGPRPEPSKVTRYEYKAVGSGVGRSGVIEARCMAQERKNGSPRRANLGGPVTGDRFYEDYKSD